MESESPMTDEQFVASLRRMFGDDSPGLSVVVPDGVSLGQKFVLPDPVDLDVDVSQWTRTRRWTEFVFHVMRVFGGKTHYTYKKLLMPFPQKARMSAFGIMEQNASSWPSPVTWKAYVTTIHDVERFVLREHPDLFMSIQREFTPNRAVSEQERVKHARAAEMAVARARTPSVGSAFAETDKVKMPFGDLDLSTMYMTGLSWQNKHRAFTLTLLKVQGDQEWSFSSLMDDGEWRLQITRFLVLQGVTASRRQISWLDMGATALEVLAILADKTLQRPAVVASGKDIERAVLTALGNAYTRSRQFGQDDTDADRAINYDQLAELIHYCGSRKFAIAYVGGTLDADSWLAQVDFQALAHFNNAAKAKVTGDLETWRRELAAADIISQLGIEKWQELQAEGKTQDELEELLKEINARRASAIENHKSSVMVHQFGVLRRDLEAVPGMRWDLHEYNGVQGLYDAMEVWSRNVAMPAWERLAKANAVTATNRHRDGLLVEYKKLGATDAMLRRYGDGVTAARDRTGPYQTFEDKGLSFTLEPLSSEEDMWLTRGMHLETPVFEFDDGWMGFGTAFKEEAPLAPARPDLGDRSGKGISIDELGRRAVVHDLLILNNPEQVQYLLAPMMGRTTVNEPWFLRDAEAWMDLFLVLDADRNGVIVLVDKKANLAVPVGAVLPSISALFVSMGDQVSDDAKPLSAPFNKHCIFVGVVHFFSLAVSEAGKKKFGIARSMEYSAMIQNDEDVERMDSPGAFRLPTCIADATRYAYYQFFTMAPDPSRGLDTHKRRRNLVSLLKNRPKQDAYPFCSAATKGNIGCELSVYQIKESRVGEILGQEEYTGGPLECFLTVRWLLSPPTLSGYEYVAAPLWLTGPDATTDKEALKQQVLQGKKKTGEYIREVILVPGYAPIYVDGAKWSKELVKHVIPFLRRDVLNGNNWFHSQPYLSGNSRPDSPVCDPRIQVALNNWRKTEEAQKYKEGQKYRGLGFWRHMEDERIKRGCGRRQWMDAWAQWASLEENRLVEEAKRKKAAKQRQKERAAKDKEAADAQAPGQPGPSEPGPPEEQEEQPQQEEQEENEEPGETMEEKRDRLLQEEADARKARELQAKEDAAAARLARGAKQPSAKEKAYLEAQQRKQQEKEAKRGKGKGKAPAPDGPLGPTPRVDWDEAMANALQRRANL